MLRSLLLTTTLLSGCSSNIVLDGGPGPDAGGPAGRLTLESEPAVTLAFGEETRIAVQYTESDVPIAGVEIRFALEGRAHDSTLLERDLAVVTDPEGRARISLLAGSVAAAFRVRASADRAAPIYVDLSVGNMGFGGLTVGAVYAGRREGAQRRVVSVYAEMDCASLAELPPFPDRTMTLEDPSVNEVHFVALPAGIPYAITGNVEGADGAVLATACADGVVIAPEDETRVDLAFEDAALVLEGEYDVELALTPALTGTSAADLTGAAGVAPIDLAGSGAALYLDALEDELRYRGETVAADTLALERPAADALLAAELDAAGTGPAVAVAALVERVRNRLSAIAIGGPLAIDAAAMGSWAPSRLSVGVIGDPDSPPLLLAPASVTMTLAPTIELVWYPERDSLDVPALTLSLPLGGLIAALLQAEADARGASDPSELLREGAGCDVLATWIGESATASQACDAECADAVCLRALGAVMGSILSVAGAAGGARDAISLSGTVAASDHDGDLEVDELSGTGFTGTWSGTLPADDLTGELSGVRISSPQ